MNVMTKLSSEWHKSWLNDKQIKFTIKLVLVTLGHYLVTKPVSDNLHLVSNLLG